MILTGVDNTKKVSIDYNLLLKKWKLIDKEGKPIYVIPSDKCLVKVEKLPEGVKKKDLEKYLKTKYGKFLFDYTLRENEYILVLVRDFEPPEEYLALDCEIFSLSRLGYLTDKEHFQILDIGRRKTTYVEVKNGFPVTYRVVLKGGDHITQKVTEALNIPFEDAEKLKISQGLELKEVKETVERILKQIPLKKELPILLSGGGSKLKGLEELFEGKAFRLNLVPPEKYSALGAALKFVYNNFSPSFAKAAITSKDLKVLGFTTAVMLLSLLLTFNVLDNFEKSFIGKLREKERYLFAEKFPDLPPVAVLDQLKSFTQGEKVSVLPLLEKAFKKLPKGVKVYKISYLRGVLTVSGEGDKKLLQNLELKRAKETADGKIAFELEVK